MYVKIYKRAPYLAKINHDNKQHEQTNHKNVRKVGLHITVFFKILSSFKKKSNVKRKYDTRRIIANHYINIQTVTLNFRTIILYSKIANHAVVICKHPKIMTGQVLLCRKLLSSNRFRKS